MLGDERTIRDDAKIFFRRADLPEDAEVDPNSDWRNLEATYRDSYSEIDPDEADHARVLQIINEFLPVKEFAGRIISVAILKQFGHPELVDIPTDEFDSLFVLVPQAKGPPTVLRLRY